MELTGMIQEKQKLIGTINYGNRGPAGPQGEKGDKGDKGEQGIQGEQGPQGPSNIFWVAPDETTFDEITSAIEAGKSPVIKKSFNSNEIHFFHLVYKYTKSKEGRYLFIEYGNSIVYGEGSYYGDFLAYICYENNIWSYSSFSIIPSYSSYKDTRILKCIDSHLEWDYESTVTDDHINELIDAKIGVIENAEY